MTILLRKGSKLKCYEVLIYCHYCHFTESQFSYMPWRLIKAIFQLRDHTSVLRQAFRLLRVGQPAGRRRIRRGLAQRRKALQQAKRFRRFPLGSWIFGKIFLYYLVEFLPRFFGIIKLLRLVALFTHECPNAWRYNFNVKFPTFCNCHRWQ